MRHQIPARIVISLALIICCAIPPASESGAAEPKQPADSADAVIKSLCGVPNCPPCVVQIRVPRGAAGYTLGSGVLLPGGRVVTAAHVVAPRFTGGDIALNGNGSWRLDGTTQKATRAEVIFPGRASGDGSSDRVVALDLPDALVRMSDPDLTIVEDVNINGKTRSLTLTRNGDWYSLPVHGDLAVLRIPKDRIPHWAVPSKLAAEGPRVGDWVVSVGLESADAVRVHTAKVSGFSDGSRAMVDEPQEGAEGVGSGGKSFMFIEVQVQSGDSGGPVFNAKGELVAINSATGSAGHVHGEGAWTRQLHDHPCSFFGSHAALVKVLAKE